MTQKLLQYHKKYRYEINIARPIENSIIFEGIP